MASLTPEQAQKVYDCTIDDLVLAGIVKRRAEAAKKHEDEAKLEDIRKVNNDLYLTKYASEKNPEEAIFADNRMFVAIRSITPYLTARLTQPEITPGGSDDSSLQFAKDFERIMVQEATDRKGKYVMRLAAQDLLKGQRRGVVKWGYDPERGLLTLKHIDPKRVRFDGDTDLFEEPTFVQEDINMTVADVLRKFPQKRAEIIQWFGLTDKQGGPEWYQHLEATKELTETHTFIDDDEDRDLVTIFMYGEHVLGALYDPLYKEGVRNIIPEPMMPYIWLNFLNDGNSKLDETSFIEQAKYSQKNYERQGQAITDNATFGTSGVPVFAKDALETDDIPKVKFSPDKRIVLDLKATGQERVSDAFTTWTAAPIQAYVQEDKYDNRNNVDNIFGTPSIFRGEKTDANTLGQDTILRDQAEGRLQEPVDCIDLAMQRFFLLEGQHIFRYFTDDDFYRFNGEDGDYEEVMLTNDKIAQNAGITIRVQGGTNLPVDRSQKIATIVKLLELNKAPTLESYKILGVFDDPDKAYKEFLQEQADPASALAEIDKAMFDREANEDLYLVIAGKVPDEREDISPEYVQHIVNWLATDKFRLLTPAQQQSVSAFAQMIQAKAALKVAKLASQVPVDGGGQPPIGPDGQPVSPGAPSPGGEPITTPPVPPAAPPQAQGPEIPGLSLPSTASTALSGITS